MTIIAIILSSLALLAAIADLGMTIRERKRSKERSAALLQYIDEKTKGIDAQTDQKLLAFAKGFSEDLTKAEQRISALESGIIPDFEKAKAAADAVNDFNAGISGILGFDPHEALKKQRNDLSGGDGF